MTKGEHLNKRVWTLFERAGFKTIPNSRSRREEVISLSKGQQRPVDLLAADELLKVKILGQHTTSREFEKSFSAQVNDIVALLQASKASWGLMVLPSMEVTDGERSFAHQQRITIWGQAELAYYETIVSAVGVYAKYEIIHSFGIKTEEETSIHNVLALRFRQPHSSSRDFLYLFPRIQHVKPSPLLIRANT